MAKVTSLADLRKHDETLRKLGVNENNQEDYGWADFRESGKILAEAGIFKDLTDAAALSAASNPYDSYSEQKKDDTISSAISGLGTGGSALLMGVNPWVAGGVGAISLVSGLFSKSKKRKAIEEQKRQQKRLRGIRNKNLLDSYNQKLEKARAKLPESQKKLAQQTSKQTESFLAQAAQEEARRFIEQDRQAVEAVGKTQRGEARGRAIQQSLALEELNATKIDKLFDLNNLLKAEVGSKRGDLTAEDFSVRGQYADEIEKLSNEIQRL